MTGSFDFRSPARVVLGSVGPPGQRVFYLQARENERLVSLKLEKQQVAFLTGGLREVLADLAGTEVAGGTDDEAALEEPIAEDWVAGSLELAYDPVADRIVLVVSEGSRDDDVPTPTDEGLAELGGPVGSTARFEMTRQQATSMIESGRKLLRSGRPPCPLCGYPLTEDHSCPKTNGHRAPSL